MIPHQSQSPSPMTVVGLMSGTSVDSIDACVVRITPQESTPPVTVEILASYHHPIPLDLQVALKELPHTTTTIQHVALLDAAIGKLFADAAHGAIELYGQPVDLIASHGQTVYHHPPQMELTPYLGMLGTTLQLGEAAWIAQRNQTPVISNFRPRDMALGGQGAPLVCLADQWLLQHPTQGRCVQNIGGIGNVTVLPAIALHQEVMAFDTGPGNMLIDVAVSTLFNRAYDADGAIAASGTVNQRLLTALMSDPYFIQPPPKSTGRERFGRPFFEKFCHAFPDLPSSHWVATLTEFTAQSIVDSYQRFVLPHTTIEEVIVGGGGAKNPVLMKALRKRLEPIGIVLSTHDDYGIDNQLKEAMAFALLGWATWHGIPGNLPGCTGASAPAVLGDITPA